MKIVIGVDDSPYSEAALEFVKKMTWPARTLALVVSAVRPPAAVYYEALVPALESMDAALEAQRRRHQELTARCEEALRGGGLRTGARVVEGDPRQVLIDAAQGEGADLIVVGSHGRSGLSKLVMGSVASHVVTHAPCSVLVVRPKARPSSARARSR